MATTPIDLSSEKVSPRGCLGGFRDLPREHGFEALRVEGKLPPDLEGTLYRVGPALNSSFGERYRHWFDGDGGIYAVRFARPDGAAFDGVASYGRRPTFDNGAPLLETYLFDFSGDLYGEDCTVTFFDWIRPEERFPSVEALVAAMAKDCEVARAMLASAGPGTALDRALASG